VHIRTRTQQWYYRINWLNLHPTAQAESMAADTFTEGLAELIK
jgi:hypothetical protein